MSEFLRKVVLKGCLFCGGKAVVNETDIGKLTDLAWKFMDKLAKRK
jgi:hypothetical protein